MGRFIYQSRQKAIEDLKIFSGVNMYQGLPIYLKNHGPGFCLNSELLPDEQPLAVGVNGQVYLPAEV